MAVSTANKLLPRSAAIHVLRFGLAVVCVAIALAGALILRHFELSHPFTSFAFVAIAISFWFAGMGPGILAVVLSCFALTKFFIPVTSSTSSSKDYLFIYAIFSILIGWFSASRRRAERLLREAHDNLELRVSERSAELRSETERLNLLLELNNSIASNLELRELLRVLSASVRRVMQCDAVGINLPDPETGELKLFALDFPAAKGFLREGMIRAVDSLVSRVFSSREPGTLTIRDFELSTETHLFKKEGLKAVCFLPLIGHNRVLGVLGLSRTEEIAFSQADIRFLMQVAAQVALAVENALAYGQIAELKDKLSQEKLYLENEIRNELQFEDIIGKSSELRRVLALVETVAPTDSTVLIYGETGTGKELIARAIHNLSHRRSNTFVRLNCAAIPSGLLESELFGHEKGAFTSAVSQRIGRLEIANQGSLFLDEIGELPLELQPKLLRVLQEREFERLGSTRTLRTDVRLIAATNRDLAVMVKEQQFRSDLFFRLNVFPIQIPPLRDRPEDIPILVRHFAEEFSRRMNKTIETIPTESMAVLCEYEWPGNIRELQNVIERAVILSPGPKLNVQVGDLQHVHATMATTTPMSIVGVAKRTRVRSILADVNREEMLQALKDAGGRVAGPGGAAARLGLKRTTFITRMKKLRITAERVSETDITDANTSDTHYDNQ